MLLIRTAAPLLLAGLLPAQTTLHQARDGRHAGDQLGRALAPAGDVDGDGAGDFLVGAPSVTASSGYVLACSGRDGLVLYSVPGSTPQDGFGAALASLGDLNGDGIPEFAVGAPDDDALGTDAGLVSVHSGADGQHLYTLATGPALGHLGAALAALGDIDGDARPDFAAGAPTDNAPGTVYLCSGVTGTPVRKIAGFSAGDGFGQALAAPGDVDLDGVPDVLIGAPGAATGGAGSGAAYLYSGATGLQILALPGSAAGDHYGMAVAGPVGDWDGDGRPDLLVTAPGDDVRGMDRGVAYVLSGAGGSLIRAFSGEADGDNFGVSAAAPGDLDGDGVADLALGAFSPATALGYAKAYAGLGAGLLASFRGTGETGGYALALAGGGDLDQNGTDELLVGAPFSDRAAANAGSAYAYGLDGPRLSGPTPGVAGAPNRLDVSGAVPQARVYFSFGTADGWTAFPGCPGLGLAMLAPNIAGTATADAFGAAHLVGQVPASFHGRALRLQAVVPSTCSASNLVLYTFP